MHKFCGSFIHNINRTITLNDPIPNIALRSIQLYFTSTTTSSGDCFANYLVNSLGFSIQKAQSASKKVSKVRTVNGFNFNSNAVSVVGFFKSHGFDDTRLRKIVSTYPRLLLSNVDNTLRPKLQCLLDRGFSESDIIRVVSANPCLLNSGVESGIVPALQVLRELMGSDTHVIAILKKPRVNSNLTKNLMPNVALLTGYGIPIEVIRKHILLHPGPFMRKHEIFKDMVTRVETKLGIPRDSPMFIYGIWLASGMSEEVIESKCRMFKSFRWSQYDIQTLMMKRPLCFALSAEGIKKKLTFLMKELRLEPAYLTSNFLFFTYSLEKRIVPRHKILLVLKEKSLLEKSPSISSAICMPESRFLKKFVLPFKEIHEVYAELTGCSMKMLTQESSETPPLK